MCENYYKRGCKIQLGNHQRLRNVIPPPLTFVVFYLETLIMKICAFSNILPIVFINFSYFLCHIVSNQTNFIITFLVLINEYVVQSPIDHCTNVGSFTYCYLSALGLTILSFKMKIKNTCLISLKWIVKKISMLKWIFELLKSIISYCFSSEWHDYTSSFAWLLIYSYCHNIIPHSSFFDS